MKVSIIMPVYNEVENLRSNFPKVYSHMKRLGPFEIIIAEDGSKDGTKELAMKFSRQYRNVKLLSSQYRLGRGQALKRAIVAATGDVIGYIDADLSVPLKYVDAAVDKIKSGEKLVVGSRYEPRSRTERDPSREFQSKFFNGMLFVTFGSKIKDHQCGFKFWDGKFAKQQAKMIRDDHWFFDSEAIIRAQKMGVTIYPLPVEWKEHRNTKVKRSDIVYFIGAIAKLRSQL